MKNAPPPPPKETYFAICFVPWSNSPPDSLRQGKVLDEREAWWNGEEGIFPLPKVELNGTVLHQDMWEERLATQDVLPQPVGHPQPPAILHVGHFNIIAALKVLRKREGVTKGEKPEARVVGPAPKILGFSHPQAKSRKVCITPR